MSSHDRLILQSNIANHLKHLSDIDHLPTGQVKLSTSAGASVYADSNPPPQADPDGRSGWYFKKTIAGTDKFNYYFYGEGSQPLTLGKLKSISAYVSVDNWQNASSAPFFNVYTKMTGVGDAGSWYHSKLTFTLDSNAVIALGERIELFAKDAPAKRIIRQVRCNHTIKTGDCLDDEEIYTISLGSDSAAPVNTQMVVQRMAWSSDSVHHVTKLIDH